MSKAVVKLEINEGLKCSANLKMGFKEVFLVAFLVSAASAQTCEYYIINIYQFVKKYVLIDNDKMAGLSIFLFVQSHICLVKRFQGFYQINPIQIISSVDFFNIFFNIIFQILFYYYFDMVC